MTLLDAATFVLGTTLVLIVFTIKNDIEKSKVKVKVKSNHKK